MKGLMNNEEAVRVFHNIKDSMINPIHQIYNLVKNVTIITLSITLANQRNVVQAERDM